MFEQNLMGDVELSVSGYVYPLVDWCRIFGVFSMLGSVGFK